MRGIAQHERLLAKCQEIAAHLLVNHGTFVDNDKAGFRGRAFLVENKRRRIAVHVFGPVDHAVDGARVATPFRAHHQCRLARVGAEGDFAIDVFGEMARKRRFARPGITEQAKYLGLSGVGKPSRDLLERTVLRRREIHS